ncbi:response regulator [Litorilinea aerophila]|nr:response regulator [Litorilinea aerophila]MCC9079016.1 response regulator [Litorilinea aerophila]OUC06835.1 hypothetical protein RY27_18535 [Litorilinea aerophila]
MSPEAPERSMPPVAFVDELKQVLAHLNDFGYLQQHALAARLAATTDPPEPAAGIRLRRAVLRAIESMSPGADVGFRSPHARTYNLLQLHYVEGFTVQEAARELGISERQAYRDIRRGEDSLAVLLEPIFLGSGDVETGPELGAAQLSAPSREIERLNTQSRPVDLHGLLRQAQRSVEKLAALHGTAIVVTAPPHTTTEFLTVPELAQQLLISVLSQIVQTDSPRLEIALEKAHHELHIALRYTPTLDERSGFNLVTAQLADQLGWKIYRHEEPDGQQAVILVLPGSDPTVLVIDDNEGLVELLKRYLRGYAYRVIGATSAQEGLQRAQEIQCDGIVLDVMMPQMDGWKVLQVLRSDAKTSRIPIIICSVINDPELAYSLGASLMLPKPVRRDDVLRALRELGISR